MLLAADADIPGVADARLAGWRAGSPDAAVADDAAEDGSPASEGNDADSGEPGCGDVVEVYMPFGAFIHRVTRQFVKRCFCGKPHPQRIIVAAYLSAAVMFCDGQCL